MSEWKEADAGNGKKYYYNATTRETRWEKPEGFDNANGTAKPDSPAVPTGPAVQPLTPDHIAAGWADAKAPNGRIYYYNRHTQETKWEYPAVGPLPQGPQHVAGPSFAAGGPQGMSERGLDAPPRRDRRDDRDHGLPQKPGFESGRGGGMPWDSRPETTGFRGAMPAKTDEPEYATPELAREAFYKLLRKHNIKYNTPWTDAMRAVIRERDYRAIKDAKDRKQAFEDYCVEARVEEIGKEKERHAKLRDEFRAMLKTHEEIKHFTRWKTARPMIEREVVFRGTEDEGERKQLFEEYILELQRKHLEDQAAARDRGLNELTGLLRTLILDVDTKWNDAKDTVMNSDRFQSDDTFRALNKLDVLKAFEHHLQYLERQANEVRQEKRRNKHTDDRKVREGFKSLLQEKLRVGQITAGSKWQDFVPQIENDERYTALIGTEGSSPLDLFWDVVEDEERKVRSKRNDALDVLDEQRFEMTPATTVDEFAAVMKRDSRASRWSHQDMTLVHQRLMEKILKREEDNKAFAERSQRKAIDALRSIIKHLEPPVRVDDAYEDIKPKLEPFDEFRALDDGARKSAFAKHIRRLQEKAEDAERDRARRDRERERERDRDYRDRGSSRRSYDYDRSDRRHRTRTPETDAYEADRRKAQEVRERSYRKASFGLTPPPRERERERRDEGDRYPARDRERSRDRRSDRERDRERYESMYERERREREMERERTYASRADPRDRGRDALDYGDEEVVGSRPGSVRKRRESDGSEGKQRDAKRTRTSKEPEGEVMAVDPKEDVALQSGSEEGEIEEV